MTGFILAVTAGAKNSIIDCEFTPAPFISEQNTNVTCYCTSARPDVPHVIWFVNFLNW